MKMFSSKRYSILLVSLACFLLVNPTVVASQEDQPNWVAAPKHIWTIIFNYLDMTTVVECRKTNTVMHKKVIDYSTEKMKLYGYHFELLMTSRNTVQLRTDFSSSSVEIKQFMIANPTHMMKIVALTECMTAMPTLFIKYVVGPHFSSERCWLNHHILLIMDSTPPSTKRWYYDFMRGILFYAEQWSDLLTYGMNGQEFCCQIDLPLCFSVRSANTLMIHHGSLLIDSEFWMRDATIQKRHHDEIVSIKLESEDNHFQLSMDYNPKTKKYFNQKLLVRVDAQSRYHHQSPYHHYFHQRTVNNFTVEPIFLLGSLYQPDVEKEKTRSIRFCNII